MVSNQSGRQIAEEIKGRKRGRGNGRGKVRRRWRDTEEGGREGKSGMKRSTGEGDTDLHTYIRAHS